MIDYLKFLFSPSGDPLSRRQYWAAIWILGTLQCYAVSRGLIFSLQNIVRESLGVSSEGYFVFSWMASSFWKSLFVAFLPIDLMLLFCIFGLAYRMLGSRGLQSRALKLFIGFCIFISFRISGLLLIYISSKFYLEKFYVNFSSHMVYFKIGLGVLSLIAFIGLVAIIVLGIAKHETGDDPFNRPNPCVPLNRQLGRVDFILAYIKLSLCCLVAGLVLSGVFFVLAYTHQKDLHEFFIIVGILGVLTMVWVMGIMAKRLRNMGKSALKYLGLFYTAVILASGTAYFLIQLGNAVSIYCGECINQAVMVTGYLFFFYLALAPHQSDSGDLTGESF